MSTGIAAGLRVDLTTRYLGLTLPHPFLCGASPLSADLEMVRRLEDAGAAAIVMHSLFQEQIVGGTMRPSPLTRPAGAYLDHLLRVKQRVRVPVIASLNGTTPEGWLQYARALERAGADALELNFYYTPTDPSEDGQAVEQRLLDVVAVIKESVAIPLAVKLSPFYSSLPNLAARLDRIAADGLVLFNRFYQPDIDPETRGTLVHLQLSDSSALLLRLHSVAILANRVRMSLAVSGGVHEPIDAVKAVMAGAHVVQLVSTLLRHGPSRLEYLRTQFEAWAVAHSYGSLRELRGAVSLIRHGDPARFDRAAYASVLDSWVRHRVPAGD
jgi:dihydroorotate dehydrogenase (fumarate)